MRQRIRKIFTLIMIALLLLSALPAAFADECPRGGSHNFDWVIEREATCSQKGERIGYCRCGTSRREAIPKKSHTYGSWKTVSEASCSQAGERTRKCKVCGHKQKESIEKKPHTWGEWTLIREASEEMPGERSHVCTVCGAAETVEFELEGTLKRGDRKTPAVFALQEMLTEEGYEPGTVDGIFGQKTEDALIAFQRDRGLKETGIARPAVLGRLAAEFAKKLAMKIGVKVEKSKGLGLTLVTKTVFMQISGSSQHSMSIYRAALKAEMAGEIDYISLPLEEMTLVDYQVQDCCFKDGICICCGGSAPEEGQEMILDADCIMYSCPIERNEYVMCRLHAGDSVTVLGKENGWLHIRSGAKEGFIKTYGAADADAEGPYNVTFVSGNGVSKTLKTDENGAAAFPEPAASDEGFVFTGWFTASLGGSEITSEYRFTSDMTLYAQYAAGDWGTASSGFTDDVTLMDVGFTDLIECSYCGKYCFGFYGPDYYCSGCEGCGPAASYSCWEKHHCPGCGICEIYAERCSKCGFCESCAGALCPECGICEDCGGPLCPECGLCGDCADLVCPECGLCGDCADSVCPKCGICEDCAGLLCLECGLCEDCSDEICLNCGLCMECAIDKGVHCKICGKCYSDDEDLLCPDCDMCVYCAVEQGKHCADCGACLKKAAYYCENCLRCSECIDEYCEHCGLCGQCGLLVGEHCTTCLKCGYVYGYCEDCKQCQDCCRSVSEAAGCTHGVCTMSPEWPVHWAKEHQGEEHTHICVWKWNPGENKHWRVCTVYGCGEILDEGPHSLYGWKVLYPSIGGSTGIIRAKCSVCGAYYDKEYQYTWDGTVKAKPSYADIMKSVNHQSGHAGSSGTPKSMDPAIGGSAGGYAADETGTPVEAVQAEGEGIAADIAGQAVSSGDAHTGTAGDAFIGDWQLLAVFMDEEIMYTDEDAPVFTLTLTEDGYALLQKDGEQASQSDESVWWLSDNCYVAVIDEQTYELEEEDGVLCMTNTADGTVMIFVRAAG